MRKGIFISAVMVLFLTLFTMGQQYNVPFSPPAAAPGGGAWQTPVSDDFNRSNEELGASASWTEVAGDSQIITNQVDWDDSTASTGLALWDDNTFAAKQCACLQRTAGVTDGFCGPSVRADSLSSTSNSYIIRWTTAFNIMALRWCADAGCTDIYEWTNTLDENNWICLCVDGADSATEFALWERATDPSAEDPTDWGNPDLCVDDNGTAILWGTCTATQQWDTPPTYRDCSGDACYAGVYNGSVNTCRQDNWSARDFK